MKSETEGGEETSQEEGPQGWPPWFERWALPYISESGLWPILLVLLVHVVLILAVAQLYTVRDRRISAGLGLIMLVVGSVEVCRADRAWHGRSGRLTLGVLGCWAAAAILAWLAAINGVL
ncbi:MAG: hypothetical protein VX498_13975 [Myxococcota bacterium]|nr:hypothetical protein [Myxococcota bacterium]